MGSTQMFQSTEPTPVHIKLDLELLRAINHSAIIGMQLHNQFPTWYITVRIPVFSKLWLYEP